VAAHDNAAGVVVTIYVDALQVYGHGPRFARQGGSCHLVATTHEELHAFAERLGLRRAWHQLHRLASHYDIAASVRVRAVRLGAVEIAGREMVRLSRAGLLARDS